MKINKINRIILFGGSIFLAEFAKLIVNGVKYDIVVFSSQRQIKEIVRDKITLSEFLDEINVPFFESEDINTSKKLQQYADENTLGVAFGAVWVFEEKTVKLFEKYQLLDFMGVDLPRYRGGAHYTWQILFQNRTAAINLQIIEGGIGTFHKGPVIRRTKYKLPASLKIPKDFFDYNVKISNKFLGTFLNDLENGINFKAGKLDETNSSHYPFLYTDINGLINWDWTGRDIAIFIDAFDEPYKGASTFYNNRRVFLKSCQLLTKKENYHPFASGVIVRKEKTALFIATVGNILEVKSVQAEDGSNIVGEIEPGEKFYTPYKELDRAKSSKAIYGRTGLVKGGS